MDLGTSIALAAAAFSATGVVLTFYTFQHTTGRDTLSAVEIEMKTFQAALTECRLERDRLRMERDNLRSENERLLRRVLSLENNRHT